MAENIYRFEFVDGTSQQIEVKTGIQDTLGSGVKEKSDKKKTDDKKSFSGEFSKKVQEDSFQNFIISPLNTVTGGLASPIANTVKRIASGASVGATLGTLGATVAIMAIQEMQKRMSELETKVQSLNNADNVLIRAGAVSKATYYSGNITGIKKRTDRS